MIKKQHRKDPFLGAVFPGAVAFRLGLPPVSGAPLLVPRKAFSR